MHRQRCCIGICCLETHKKYKIYIYCQPLSGARTRQYLCPNDMRARIVCTRLCLILAFSFCVLKFWQKRDGEDEIFILQRMLRILNISLSLSLSFCMCVCFSDYWNVKLGTQAKFIVRIYFILKQYACTLGGPINTCGPLHTTHGLFTYIHTYIRTYMQTAFYKPQAKYFRYRLS